MDVPGLDREITLGEMIDLKLIDHTKCHFWKTVLFVTNGGPK